MKNYEKIKNMSLDELVEFIREASDDVYVCSYCNDEECEQNFLNRDYSRCDKGIRQWLESEEQQ